MKKLLFSTFRLCLFLGALFVVCTLPLRADDSMRWYTTNTIGDTVLTYGDDNRYTARLYAFVDGDSCSMYMQALSDITRVLLERHDVQIVLFMRVRHEAAIERFRKEYNWNFPIVHDVATAYKQAYNIVRYPVCILTDGAGVIAFVGVPGKPEFNLKACEHALAGIKKHDDSGDSLTRLQQWVVKSGGVTPIRNWIAQFGTHVQGKDEFILWSFFSKEFLWIDGRGNILKKTVLTEFPENHGSTIPRPIFFAGEAAPNYIPFLNLNFVDITATMYNVHRNADTLERLWDIPPPDSLHSPATTAFRLSDTSFLIGYMYSDRAAVRQNPDVYTARIVNTRGEITGTLGRYESYNQSRYVMSYFMQSFCRDGAGNVYMIESLADTIRVYNQTGVLLRSIACEYDSTLWHYRWQEDFLPLHEESPVEELMKPSDRITKVAGVNGLFYDLSGQRVYVVYQRKIVTPAGNTSYRFFLHRPGLERKAIRRDLALPGDAKPFYIENGRLYCTETIDGVLNLVIYAVPDWL